MRANYDLIHRLNLYDVLINPALFVEINRQLSRLEGMHLNQRLVLV